MKLLSINLARSIWLGPMIDFNPKGLYLYPSVISLLVGTYKFKKVPSPSDVLDLTKGVAFENGEFRIDEKASVVIHVTIYNDGVVATASSSTEHADAFLLDAFSLFSTKLGLPDHKQILKRKVYASQLFVSTNRSLELLNPKLAQISKYLSNNVEEGDKTFHVGGVHLWPDQIIGKNNPPPFTFERAAGAPFSDKRYFSSAPLPTHKHLELLEQIEAILSRR